MCNCSSNITSSCSSCAPVQSCNTGCSTTMNTDCVFFNKELLPSESPDTLPNSNRSLTTILQNLHNETLLTSEFHTLGDGPFTLDANSNYKLIILEDREGVIGTNVVITLPNSMAYAGKVFTFLNRTPVVSGQWVFNQVLTTDYDPLTTSNNYNTIVSGSTKILKLAFVQVTPTAYGWVILKN